MNEHLTQFLFFAQGTARRAVEKTAEKAAEDGSLNILQILLLAGGLLLLASTWYAMARGRASLAEAVRWSVVLVAICFFAVFPKLSNRIAQKIGIDSGRFLVLYVSVILLFVAVVLLYSRTRKLSREITLLVREIAIQRGHDAAEAPPGEDARDS